MSSRPERADAHAGGEAAERARRVAALLERWEREDVSDEPDWDASSMAGIGLRSPEPDPAR